MTTLANTMALVGMAMIRFGGRSGGGFAFLIFGLLIVGAVAWALARPVGNDVPRSEERPSQSSPAAGAQE